MRYKITKEFNYTEEIFSRGLPSQACLEITYRCNFNCIHCFNCPSHDKELSYGEIISVLDQLAEAGVIYLKLSGGEPLIRKDFFDIARYARKTDFALTIFTNAALITEEVADKISQLYPLAVKVSLYGPSEKFYRKITGSTNSFYKAIRGIRLLSERKIRVIVTSLMFNFYAVKDVLAMKTICKDLGVEWLPFYFFTLKTNGSPGPLKCGLSESKFTELYKRIAEIRPEPSSKPSIHKWICSTLRCNIHINPYGQVGTCLYSIIKESVREKSLLDIWKRNPIFMALRKLTFKDLTTCFSCKSLPYCRPCPGTNFITTGSFTTVPSRGCQQARIVAKVAEKFKMQDNKNKISN